MSDYHKIARRLSVFVLLVMIILGCRSVSAATPKLNKVEARTYVGRTFRLYPSSGKATNWRSYNTKVATVSKNGAVTGRKKGTATICCTVSGKTLKCTVNVQNTQTSKYVSNKYAEVWLNILGAVETGGQSYGNRNYASYIGPYTGSPNEHSSTAGAYQEYGENLRQLLLMIQKQYPTTFKAKDTAKIASDIKHSWSSSPYTVKAGTAKARCIQRIISCYVGKLVQDQRAIELLDEYLKGIKKLGVKNLRCGLFMAECYHLGGYAAVKRVVARATNKNSLVALRKSLYLDQKDKSSSYQIGDQVYKSRHEAIYKWLATYIPSSTKF